MKVRVVRRTLGLLLLPRVQRYRCYVSIADKRGSSGVGVHWLAWSLLIERRA